MFQLSSIKAGLVPAFFLSLVLIFACERIHSGQQNEHQKIKLMAEEAGLLKTKFNNWKLDQCSHQTSPSCLLVDSLMVELDSFNLSLKRFAITHEEKDAIAIGIADLEYRLDLLKREADLLRP